MTVTGLAVPVVLVAKLPAAPELSMATKSPATAPVSEAPLRSRLAAVVPS